MKVNGVRKQGYMSLDAKIKLDDFKSSCNVSVHTPQRVSLRDSRIKALCL